MNCPKCEKPTLDYDRERKRYWCRDVVNCAYVGVRVQR